MELAAEAEWAEAVVALALPVLTEVEAGSAAAAVRKSASTVAFPPRLSVKRTRWVFAVKARAQELIPLPLERLEAPETRDSRRAGRDF
jgi:hypothetical protein